MSKRQFLEIGGEVSEFALDQIMDNGILKELPIVGWLAKISDIGLSIRDNLYANKLKVFLLCLEDITATKKDEFKSRVIENSEEVEYLSEKILMVAEQLSDTKKSEIIANLFLAYLDGKISNKNFRRSLDVTNNFFLDDLLAFIGSDAVFSSLHRVNQTELNRDGIGALSNSPLLEVYPRNELEGDGIGAGDMISDFYQVSDFGSEYRHAYHHGKSLRDDKNAEACQPQFESK